MQWDGLKKAGKLPHAVRWYDHVSGVPELKALAEKYHPKRRSAVAKEGKEASKKGAGNTGTLLQHHCRPANLKFMLNDSSTKLGL